MKSDQADDVAEWEHVWELFHAALEQPQDRRQQFLEHRCPTDTLLQQRVWELIGAHEGADDFMTASPLLETGIDPKSLGDEPEPGDYIGRYRIVRPIGHGGMGDVYLADQDEPVRRQVALKILQLGLSTREILGRFEAERQALALMSHSNIARVYDAGTTDVGRPYFVMEYVAGEPVTEYCDQRRLTLHQRIQIFLRICDGVQHAHQKGIIHRDLKPSNVLVTEENGLPVPKIIDFGIAKATHQSLTDETMHTRMGSIVGTPTYMSPEQAGLVGVDVDIRADVYSLSVLLYELLVGVTPFESTSLKGRGYAEVQRMIREEEPIHPGTRLGRMTAEQIETFTKARGTTSRRLKYEFESDLAWIALKGMEKARDRRYPTVAELAAELHRYLNGMPVQARAPTARYRASKFVMRHKLGVGISAAVLGLLVAVAISMTVQSVRLERALNETTLERNRAEQVTEFLVDLFDAANPDRSQGASVTVREMLDRGAERLDGDLTDQPELRGTLMSTMGQAYRVLGVYDRADEAMQKALADQLAVADGPGVAATLNDLGEIAHDTGDLPKAEDFYRRALAAHEADPAGGVAEQTVALNNLATLLVDSGDPAAALDFAMQALTLRREHLGSRSKETANVLETVSSIMSLQGDHAGSLEMAAEALDIHREISEEMSPAVASSLNFYANALRRLGDNAGAKESLQQAVSIYRSTHGEDHLYLASSLNNLALTFNIDGEYAQAEVLLKEALGIVERAFDEDHPQVNTMRLNLGATEKDLGNYVDAEVLLRRAVEGDRKAFGESVKLSLSLDQLGLVLRNLGNFSEAAEMHSESLALRLKFAGEKSNSNAAISLHNLAVNRMSLGAGDEALDLLDRALELHWAGLGDSHPSIAATLAAKGAVLQSLGRLDEGERHYSQALAMQRATLTDDNPSITSTLEAIASLAAQRQQYELAAEGYREVLRRHTKNDESINRARVAWTEGSLGLALCRLGQTDEGAQVVAQGGARLEQALPADNWQLAVFDTFIGECLMHQGELTAAEERLLASYEVVVDAVGKASLPSQRVETKLAALYDALGDTDRAAQFRGAVALP